MVLSWSPADISNGVPVEDEMLQALQRSGHTYAQDHGRKQAYTQKGSRLTAKINGGGRALFYSHTFSIVVCPNGVLVGFFYRKKSRRSQWRRAPFETQVLVIWLLRRNNRLGRFGYLVRFLLNFLFGALNLFLQEKPDFWRGYVRKPSVERAG
jgi:hypothetical protein